MNLLIEASPPVGPGIPALASAGATSSSVQPFGDLLGALLSTVAGQQGEAPPPDFAGARPADEYAAVVAPVVIDEAPEDAASDTVSAALALLSLGLNPVLPVVPQATPARPSGSPVQAAPGAAQQAATPAEAAPTSSDQARTPSAANAAVAAASSEAAVEAISSDQARTPLAANAAAAAASSEAAVEAISPDSPPRPAGEPVAPESEPPGAAPPGPADAQPVGTHQSVVRIAGNAEAMEPRDDDRAPTRRPADQPPSGVVALAVSSPPAASLAATSVEPPLAPAAPQPLPPAAQVARAVIESVVEGGGEVRLRLDPPDLGEIVIRVSVDGGLVRVDVQTDNAEAARLLRDATPNLSSLLGDRGLGLADVSVGQGGSDHTGPGFGDEPARQQGATDTTFAALMGIDTSAESRQHNRVRATYNPDGAFLYRI